MNSKITTVIMMMAVRLGTPGARMDNRTVATLRVNRIPRGISTIRKRRVDQRHEVVVSREVVGDGRIKQRRLELMSNLTPGNMVKVTFNFRAGEMRGVWFLNPVKRLRFGPIFWALNLDVT